MPRAPTDRSSGTWQARALQEAMAAQAAAQQAAFEREAAERAAKEKEAREREQAAAAAQQRIISLTSSMAPLRNQLQESKKRLLASEVRALPQRDPACARSPVGAT